MKPAHTRLLLALGLLGTLALVWFAPGDDGVAAPADKATQGRKATAVRSKTSGPPAAGPTIASPEQLNNPQRPALPENVPD
ncbi:MAG: hypothetical protein WAV95_13585, partial [Azonexus sp.]